MYNNSRSHTFSFPLFWWAPSSNRGRKARDCSGPGWSILADITPSLVSKTKCELLQRGEILRCAKRCPVLRNSSCLGSNKSLRRSSNQRPLFHLREFCFPFFCWKTVIVRSPVVCPCLPPYNNTWNPGFGRCIINIASTQYSHRYLNFLTGPVTVSPQWTLCFCQEIFQHF